MTNDLGKLSVLITDDDQFMQSLMERMLGTLGISQIAKADDGQAALDWLEGPENKADVILLDLNMPGMDGLETLRHLAARDEPPALVLIRGEDTRVLSNARGLSNAWAANAWAASHPGAGRPRRCRRPGPERPKNSDTSPPAPSLAEQCIESTPCLGIR